MGLDEHVVLAEGGRVTTIVIVSGIHIRPTAVRFRPPRCAVLRGRYAPHAHMAFGVCCGDLVELCV